MKAMLRSLVAVLLLGLAALVIPAASLAKAPDRLKSLTVSAWLEYDRPGALYIYWGELPEGTSFPAQISFRLPKSSGGPSSTAGVDAAGNFRYIRPTLSEDGDSIVVTYEINWPRFQIEYYDDNLQRQDQGRQLDLVYRADYAVDQLDLEIKEPYAATNWSLNPAGSTQSKGDDGLMVHQRRIGPVTPGQEIRWQASYTKADARLSADALGFPTPSTSQYEAGAGMAQPASADHQALLAVLLGLVVAALGGLVWWYLARRPGGGHDRKPAPEAVGLSPRQRRRSAKKGRAARPTDAQPAGHCSQCGTPFSEGDAFCRRCGTRRRVD